MLIMNHTGTYTRNDEKQKNEINEVCRCKVCTFNLFASFSLFPLLRLDSFIFGTFLWLVDYFNRFSVDCCMYVGK